MADDLFRVVVELVRHVAFKQKDYSTDNRIINKRNRGAVGSRTSCDREFKL